MARARNIKPGFFKNPELVELPFETRLLFIGLWTLADREGYLQDRPKAIRMELFPADDVNVEECLKDLAAHGFITRYAVGESRFIHIAKFTEHQHPHHAEKPSTIPKPETNPSQTLVKTKANPSDSLIPDSLNPEERINTVDSLTTVDGKTGEVLSGAPEPIPKTGPGEACLAIREAGIAKCNPQHPKLRELVAQGATAQEFADATRYAKSQGKATFGYVLATVEGRRRDASDPNNPQAQRAHKIAQLTGGSMGKFLPEQRQ